MRPIVLTLILVLLLTGSGEAGEPDWSMKMPKPLSGGTVDCRYWYESHIGGDTLRTECKARDEPTCYQRMKEAMRAMDAFTPLPSRANGKDVYMHTLQGPDTYPPVYQQWVQTFKDCVKETR